MHANRNWLARLIPAATAAVAIAAFSTPAAFAAAKPAAQTPAQPSAEHGHADSGVVFVLTDNTKGNAVIAYRRAADGTLAEAGTYPTGGLGGVLSGSVVDHTASQGALAYDQARGLLLAVNPGSDTVSVFRVLGDRLALSQVISSGGAFPVSVTVHGDHAYVLNALGGGSLYGYQIDGGRITPTGSFRTLGLGTTAASAFTATPGQVAFTPDGRALLVTTKGSGNDVDVFAVHGDGTLSATPVVNPEPADVPFAISFDRAGQVLIAEAGPSALATFTLSPSGVLTQLAVADTGQAATCWVARAGRYFYTSNAGSASVSGYAVAPDGSLTALGNTSTGAGTVDATAAGHGQFLYVRAGADGLVDEFAVRGDGTLTPVGSVTVPGGAGGEGIAAS